MATLLPRRQFTFRDEDILSALDRCPLTVQQLLKLSQTFRDRQFTSARSVQDRLQKLRQAGWVRRWTYATASRGGAPDYYKLTLLGYRLLHGQSAQPPTKRYFDEVGLAHQHHTHALAEFVVHTAVAAHREGVKLTKFRPENTLRLQVGQETLFPDCAFELHTGDGRCFNFFVELDNGTERVRSEKDADSWQRKIRLYEQLQDESYPRRFRVLIVTTKSRDRLDHILAVASTETRNPRRCLLYATHLDDYLRQPEAIGSPCFRDHQGRPVALLTTASQPRTGRSWEISSPPARPSGIVLPLPMATSPSPREPRSSGLPSPTS